jgi:nitroimidazol reductase NimA-like FMN-containing flavoprotein (pyridoxamine 5'-phosphate oxidase superfamily)
MERTAADIIQKTIYAAVATSSAYGTPWNSPVYIVYDEALNFYWASDTASQHSRNMHENPSVFLVIFDSSVPWGEGKGIFIQATATEVDDRNEIANACHLRVTRASGAKQPPEDFIGDRPRRIYKAAPEKIWMNQDGQVDGHFIDERIAMDISKIQREMAV